jgi:hypothetical protein
MTNGNNGVYQLANKAYPKSHEPHRLGRIHEEDSDDYRKLVLTKHATTKAGVYSDAPQPPSPSPQSESAYTNGANKASGWSIVPSTGQTVNSQSVSSLIPWPYSIDAALSMTSLPTLGTRSATFLPISGDCRYVHPAYWTVQETVHWLRSKGFEETVCQRFVEEEIAGDALLDLDVSKLKTEVGIIAYGKRVRIHSAISECRRLARAMSSSAIQPMRPGSSSHSDLPSQQSTALGRASFHSASTGNLPSPTPPDPGSLRKAPSTPGLSRYKDNSKDLDEQSTADKSDVTTTGLRLLVSSWLSSGGSQGKTAVSVQFWRDMWDMISLFGC